MTVFAPRRTVRRPKMVIVRCCGWREQTRRRLPTCDADLFSPPPLPVYQGLEFIEFAVSAAEAQRLGQHLQALGFQHEEATAPDR